MKREPLSNIHVTCSEHASKPNPALHHLRPTQYVGRYVKIAFEGRPNPNEREHMWVHVTGVGDVAGMLVGILNNDPVLDVGVTCGGTVVFPINHIEGMED